MPKIGADLRGHCGGASGDMVDEMTESHAHRIGIAAMIDAGAGQMEAQCVAARRDDDIRERLRAIEPMTTKDTELAIQAIYREVWDEECQEREETESEALNWATLSTAQRQK
jgi:hypothetical protein